MNDPNGPRRFSTVSAILPPKIDDGLKASPYGGTADPGEVESLLGEGIIQEYTSMKRESSLLFKYSLPLTLTYLLQVSLT
jgi:MATE family multidrug resistance protein